MNVGTLIALFTPDVPFTACEISNSGTELILGENKHFLFVVLLYCPDCYAICGLCIGLKGKKAISTILCRKNGSVYDEEPTEPFGDEGNKGKRTNLKET